jgi:hypothetical protein
MVEIAGALGDEAEGAAVPVAKPVGPECSRLLPDARIVVGAVKVEKHPFPLGEVVAPPVERPLDTAAHGGEKRIEPAHLLHEPLKVSVVAGRERPTAFGIIVQRHRREGHVPGDGHGRPQDIDQLDRRDAGASGSPF